MEYTAKQIRDWKTYHRIQEQGLFNMFDPRVRMLTGMSKDEHLFCMEHYDELKKAAERECVK